MHQLELNEGGGDVVVKGTLGVTSESGLDIGLITGELDEVKGAGIIVGTVVIGLVISFCDCSSLAACVDLRSLEHEAEVGTVQKMKAEGGLSPSVVLNYIPLNTRKA